MGIIQALAIACIHYRGLAVETDIFLLIASLHFDIKNVRILIQYDRGSPLWKLHIRPLVQVASRERQTFEQVADWPCPGASVRLPLFMRPPFCSDCGVLRWRCGRCLSRFLPLLSPDGGMQCLIVTPRPLWWPLRLCLDPQLSHSVTGPAFWPWHSLLWSTLPWNSGQKRQPLCLQQLMA